MRAISNAGGQQCRQSKNVNNSNWSKEDLQEIMTTNIYHIHHLRREEWQFRADHLVKQRMESK